MFFAAGVVGETPAMAWLIPFLTILGCIAVLPLIPATHHWWEENKNKLLVSGIVSAPVLWFLFTGDHLGHLHHSLVEYVQFILLLGSLYYVSGGILLRGDIAATPKVNTTFLGVGALLASFIGTTGASMLLIRPLLKTNSERKYVVHTVVFFIFVVSNIGGCLTPLGDPPLFLGFLRGVPFEWTFTLWPQWLFLNVLLLIVYFIWDSVAYKKEDLKDANHDHANKEPLSVSGSINFLLLGGVIVAVAGSQWMHTNLSLKFFAGYDVNHHPELFYGSPWRELLMVLMAYLSKVVTQKGLREENKFTFGPIGEVAALFIGIFIAMIPALMILKAEGRGMMEGLLVGMGYEDPASQLAVMPAVFFWMTGLLSSFLDNAPTYVTFFEMARSLGLEGIETVADTGVPLVLLTGISLGAVFMGANTYIGNGPNFMVKAVAEEANVKMPSFFGYMAYSFGILIPLFVIVNLIFF